MRQLSSARNTQAAGLLLRPSAVDFEVQNNESLYIYIGPDVS